VRQPAQPAGDLLGTDPIGSHKCLALAERGVEPRVAKRDAALDTGQRNIALDSRELE